MNHALEQENAIAFVAGGNGGIGLAMIQQLLDLPNVSKVYASWKTASRAGALQALERSCPERLILIEADCTDPAGIARVAEFSG